MKIVLHGHQKSSYYDDSNRIRTALNRLEAAGGGKLVLQDGIFFSGPFQLCSNMHLFIDRTAILSFIPDFNLYKPVWTRWEGVESWAMHPLIFAKQAQHITISGKGEIDGNGEAWWNSYWEARKSKRKNPLYLYEIRLATLNEGYKHQPSGGGGREIQFLRPPLLQLFECEDVMIQDITLKKSPFWNTHLVYCKNCIISRVQFLNPKEAPNTDGLNLDSCSVVTVKECSFNVGDDCLGLKSGSGEDGIRIGRPTEQVTIEHCTMKNGHGGVVIGSETAGGIKNITISHCTMEDTDRGLRIKTRRGRGGCIENITLKRTTMKRVLCPLVINCYYGPGGPDSTSPVFSLEAQPLTITTPAIRNIAVSGLRADDCKAAAAFIVGLPEQPIEAVRIKDSCFSLSAHDIQPANIAAMYRGLPSVSGRGIRLRNIKGITIENTEVVFPDSTNEQKEPYLKETGIQNFTVYNSVAAKR